MNLNDFLEKKMSVLNTGHVGSIGRGGRGILELSNGNILMTGSNGQWELFSRDMVNIKLRQWTHGSTRQIRTSLELLNGNILIAGTEGRLELFSNDMVSISSGILYQGGLTISTLEVMENGNVLIVMLSGHAQLINPNLERIKTLGWSSDVVFNSTTLPNGNILLVGGDGVYRIIDKLTMESILTGKWNHLSSSIYDISLLPNGNILLVGASGRWQLFNSDMTVTLGYGDWIYGSVHIYSSTTLPNGNILLVGADGRWQIVDRNITNISSGYWVNGTSQIYDSLLTSTGRVILGGSGGYTASYLLNHLPVISDNTESNKVFYEGDTIVINGSVTDSDNGNVMSVKYKINGGTTRAIATGISNGTTPLNYSKTLKYTLGTLKDGSAIIANGLVDGQSYKITIWAEDDQGGKSPEVVRNFTVVPNRAPVLSVNPITNQNNKINSEKITISGSVTDADGNDVTVDVKINSNASVQIYSGIPSDFSFDIKIADLKEGENTITVISKDTFNFVTTKVIKLNKARNAVPLKTAIARYKVNPPTGSAKEILAWIQKESGDLTIDADVSMKLSGESESYVAMNKLTAPINDTLEEDEFIYQALEEKDNITMKLKMTKLSELSTESIKQISGVLG